METMHHFSKVPGDEGLPPQAAALKALVSLYHSVMDWQNGTVPQEAGTRAEIEERITRGHAGVSSDEALSYGSLVEQAAAAHGCKAEAGKELVWLDCPHIAPVEGGDTWMAKYHVCRMQVGQPRQADVAHTAYIVPQPDAPEGFAVSVQP